MLHCTSVNVRERPALIECMSHGGKMDNGFLSHCALNLSVDFVSRSNNKAHIIFRAFPEDETCLNLCLITRNKKAFFFIPEIFVHIFKMMKVIFISWERWDTKWIKRFPSKLQFTRSKQSDCPVTCNDISEHLHGLRICFVLKHGEKTAGPERTRQQQQQQQQQQQWQYL